MLADVRFSFDDAGAIFLAANSANEDLPDQIARDVDGGAVEE
jgi:hypothetical protein